MCGGTSERERTEGMGTTMNSFCLQLATFFGP